MDTNAVTIVISVISLLVSVATYWRAWRWREGADIEALPVTMRLDFDGNSPMQIPAAVATVYALINIGDGDAYHLHAWGVGCQTQLIETLNEFQTFPNTKSPTIPFVKRSLNLQYLRIFRNDFGGPANGEEFVVMHWIEKPTRLHKCRTKVIYAQAIGAGHYDRLNERSLFYRSLISINNHIWHWRYHHWTEKKLQEWEKKNSLHIYDVQDEIKHRT